MSDISSVQSGKKPPKDSSTQRYLPFSEIRDNMIIMKDGSSRMVLKVHALNFNLKSTEEQDAILMSYQRFLNSLSFPIQIIVRSLKVDIEAYINRLKNIAIKQQNPLLQEQTYKYIDFLVNLIDLAQIMKKEFYIVVPFDFENDESVRKTDMFGIFRSFWSALSQEESVADIRANRSRLEKLKK
jgi:type IV secretory pathway VirB4 component